MNFHLATPLAGCIICLILTPLLVRGSRRSPVRQTVLGFLFFTAFYGFALFSMRGSPDVAYAFAFEKPMIIMVTGAAILFYHFSFYFSRIKPPKMLMPTLYLFLLAFIPLAYAGLIVSGMETGPYGYVPIPGPLFALSILSTYPFLILAVVNLNKGYKASKSYEERTRYLYVAIGIFFNLIGSLLDVVSTFGAPITPGGGSIGSIIFCIFTAVAILRFHLLDIHIVIRKGVAYLVTSSIVAITYVTILFLLNHFFGTGNIPFSVHFTLLLALSFVLLILWRGVQRLVDRWFYRERYDFLEALENFSREPHDLSDIKQLGFSLVRLIDLALQTSGVHLLLLSESGDFNVIAATSENATQLTLKNRSRLLQWLRSNKGLLHRQELDALPQLQSLTAKERRELEAIGAELFVPLKAQKDELIGVLVLSKRLSEQPYSDEDERLIITVASRVAIELENARLYRIETMMRQELQRQDEQKTEFLHIVAHELKTPLTAIISASELIDAEASSATPSQRERLIRNINRSAWLMDKKVSELLDLAKVQIGNLELKVEPTEINVIIEEVASQLHSLFKMKKQSLVLELPDSLSPAKADRERIEQVLLNLMSNANKFSPAGGKITLRAKEIDDRIVVEVQDSAPVITEEDKDKLFDAYYRAGDIDERQRTPGLGLGLAICKRLIELHQGRIWIESEPGKGNSFVFSLPI